MKCVLLESGTMDKGDVDLSPILSNVETTIYSKSPKELIVARARGFDIVAVNKLPIDGQVLDQLPECKVILVTATGFDSVDIEACSQRGVLVYNVKGYSSSSVAQHVLACIFDHTNRIAYYAGEVHKERWARQSEFCFYDHTIPDLNDCTIGVLGYGNIGKRVTELAQVLGMSVLVNTRRSVEFEKELRISYADKQTLFEQSDFISLHVPLTPSTREIVDKKLLSIMKPSAVLINTARGGVINEEDLRKALEEGRPSAAYIDVLQREPPVENHPLIQLKNCYVTPHLAWTNVSSRQGLVNGLGDNIIDFVQNGGRNSLNFDDISS